MIWRGFPLQTTPVVALEPFRIADRYGLFAVMTRGRYEIEFQGSADGQNWVPYPFRFKPQDPSKAPGIYAPYQPRFDWNLWFASLGDWRSDPIVTRTEERLLTGEKDVLPLFAGNPFPHEPPRQVRAVLWQYWFTTLAELLALISSTRAMTLRAKANRDFACGESSPFRTAGAPLSPARQLEVPATLAARYHAPCN
jgi:hypothetical protein